MSRITKYVDSTQINNGYILNRHILFILLYAFCMHYFLATYHSYILQSTKYTLIFQHSHLMSTLLQIR